MTYVTYEQTLVGFGGQGDSDHGYQRSWEGTETVKTNAAVMWESSGNFEITELELDGPKDNEVLVRFDYAGLCHSDEHLRHGDLTIDPPMVGGHEGSGLVEEVGPGVRDLKPGDHFISSWMPFCGKCRFCMMGKSNLCDNGAFLMQGTMLDGTQRLHARGKGMGGVDLLGTFSQWNVIPEAAIVKIEPDLPLDIMAILACGVPTGWGSAVYAAGTQPGDVTVVYGIGGIGINAIQGASHAGARLVVAIDPLEFKRETAMKLGATHSFADAQEARDFVWDATRGQGADAAIVTVGLVEPQVVNDAFAIIRKAGTVVVTALANPNTRLEIPSLELTLYEKRVVGSLFGSGAPHQDIRKMIELYRVGHLRLDELITTRYPLEDVNLGYDDLLAGKNIRGILEIAH
jgi:alcohol dehydrogenase (nicotinoprotein)